jgi:hypothetical protein
LRYSEEVNNICKEYYDKECLYDLIHNILIKLIVENIGNFEYNFIEQKF